MLRKILESKLGPLTNSQFREVLDLATTDIKVNLLVIDKDKRQRTSLKKFTKIARSCFITMGRGHVA